MGLHLALERMLGAKDAGNCVLGGKHIDLRVERL